MRPASRARVSPRVAAWAALACLLETHAAHGQTPSGLTLRWDAPDECPQAAWVRDRVRALAGPTRVPGIAAEGTVRREGKQYRLELIVHDDAGTSERRLEAQSCVDLAGAAAVQLGLLLHDAAPHADGAATGTGGTAPHADGAATGTGGTAPRGDGATKGGAAGANTPGSSKGGGASSPTNPRAPAAASTPAAARPRGDEPQAESGSGKERSWHVGLAAPLGTLEIGPLPKPIVGVAAAAAFELGVWQLFVGGQLVAPEQRVPIAGAPGYASVVSRWAGSASVCYGFGGPRFDAGPCAALVLEHVSARGEGPDSGQSRPWNLVGVARGGGTRAMAPFAFPRLAGEPQFENRGCSPPAFRRRTERAGEARPPFAMLGRRDRVDF